MTAATLIEPVDADREANPDWVVIARVMWGQDPQCVPTESETRAAVWLLLDQGYMPREVERHTGLSERTVARVHDLRKLATEPARKRGPHGTRRSQRAAAQGPSQALRNILHGVRGRVRVDEALLVTRMVSGRRR